MRLLPLLHLLRPCPRVSAKLPLTFRERDLRKAKAKACLTACRWRSRSRRNNLLRVLTPLSRPDSASAESGGGSRRSSRPQCGASRGRPSAAPTDALVAGCAGLGVLVGKRPPAGASRAVGSRRRRSRADAPGAECAEAEYTLAGRRTRNTSEEENPLPRGSSEDELRGKTADPAGAPARGALSFAFLGKDI